MGTQLPRLALLLAVLQYAVLVAPTGLVMDELLTHGGRRILKAQWNNKYLTGREDLGNDYVLMQNGPPGGANHWTIVQINDYEVAFRAANGMYLSQARWMQLAEKVDTWEKWTPVKNQDGSWSFKTQRDNSWLSAREERGYVEGGERILESEKWQLETWELKPHMAELLADGGRRILKAWNKKYLTGQKDHSKNSVEMTAGPPGDANHWTIVQMNDNEISIRAANGKFLQHDSPIDIEKTAGWYEMWTPVKNEDGSWSFKSRSDGWLSAHNVKGIVEAMPANDACEKWTLETWQPDAHMAELTANNGRHSFKSACSGGYLTAQKDDSGWDCLRATVVVKDKLPGDASHWTIVQMSDKEVALRASNGQFLRHNNGLLALVDLASTPDDWEMWTPVKNEDGSWSFKSRYDGWLGAHWALIKNPGRCQKPFADTQAEIKLCEKWWLESW